MILCMEDVVKVRLALHGAELLSMPRPLYPRMHVHVLMHTRTHTHTHIHTHTHTCTHICAQLIRAAKDTASARGALVDDLGLTATQVRCVGACASLSWDLSTP